MFRIYRRQVSASVPSWDWLFTQLRNLGRKLARLDDESLKDASLDRDHFVPGFWLEADGARWSRLGEEVSSNTSFVFHDVAHSTGQSHIGVGEYCSLPIRRYRVLIDSNATGNFMASYSVLFRIKNPPYAPVALRHGVYSTVHVDGRRIDAATDYTADNYSFQWTYPGAPDPLPTNNSLERRVSGHGFVGLIEGFHTIEVMLHTHKSLDVVLTEVSLAEVH